MVIRQFKNDDTLSLFNIWRECFTDDTNYINNFLKNCLPYTETWVLIPENESTPVSVVTVIPSYIIENKTVINGGYIFGVGTLIKHRGHSYSKHIINTIFNHSKSNNLSYLLVKPAEHTLYNLYKRLSFDKTILKKVYHTELNVSAFPVLKHKSIAVTFDQYHKLREESLHNRAFIWPKEILKYATEELALRGGAIKFLETDSKTIFYAAHPLEENAETIKIIDHNINDANELNIVIRDIASLFRFAKKVTFESDSDHSLMNKYTTTESALYKIIALKMKEKSFGNKSLAYTME